IAEHDGPAHTEGRVMTRLETGVDILALGQGRGCIYDRVCAVRAGALPEARQGVALDELALITSILPQLEDPEDLVTVPGPARARRSRDRRRARRRWRARR